MSQAGERVRRSLTARLGLPEGFFTFDVKDTLRVIGWIIFGSFTLGGLWAQRKADMAAITERIGKSEAVSRDLATRVDADQQGRAAILTSLEGIHTELRYVNEKIDVLRQDLHDTRAIPRQARE